MLDSKYRVGIVGGTALSNTYDFYEQLLFSNGTHTKNNIYEIIKNNIPNIVDVKKANNIDDRNGTDYWAIRNNLPSLSIDTKIMKLDPMTFKNPNDVIPLETYSVIESKKPGWTRDETKRTDYILWFWVATKRWCIIPFPLLCMIFQEKWQLWRKQFRVAFQSSGAWKSECVFVPRREIWAEIYRKYSGNVVKVFSEVANADKLL